jgi:hypothetical protein
MRGAFYRPQPKPAAQASNTARREMGVWITNYLFYFGVRKGVDARPSELLMSWNLQ